MLIQRISRIATIPSSKIPYELIPLLEDAAQYKLHDDLDDDTLYSIDSLTGLIESGELPELTPFEDWINGLAAEMQTNDCDYFRVNYED